MEAVHFFAIFLPFNFYLLTFLRAVFTSAPFAVSHACAIENAADNMITDARQVSYSSAPDKDGAVFLQVMVDARDIGRHFFAVCQSYTGDFTQCGVRFLWRLSPDYQTDASFLGRA
jgi:hypothetical protein